MLLRLNPLQWYLVAVTLLVMSVATIAHYDGVWWLLERFPETITRVYVGCMLLWFLIVFAVYGASAALLLRNEDRALSDIRKNPTSQPVAGTLLAQVWRDADTMSSIDSRRKMRINAFQDQYERLLSRSVDVFGNNETLMVYLGLAGTVIGLILSMPSDVSMVTQGVEKLVSFLIEVLAGIAFAFSTTAVGVVTSIVIKLMRDNYESKIGDMVAECGVLLEGQLLRLHPRSSEDV